MPPVQPHILEIVAVGVKRQRHEALEAAGLRLQVAQQHEMLDALFDGLHMTVQHGAVGLDPEPVRHAVHVEPLLDVRLVRADDVADAFDEDLGAAPVERGETGVAQPAQSVLVRAARPLAHVIDLGRGEQRQLDVRDARVELGDGRDPKLEAGLLGIVSADDMQFVVVVGLGAGLVEDRLERHAISAIFFFAPRRTSRTCSLRSRYSWC